MHSSDLHEWKVGNKKVFLRCRTHFPDYFVHITVNWERLPSDRVVKFPPANAGDTRDASLILGEEDPRKKKQQPTPIYSRLGNPTQRGTWQTVIHEVARSRTRSRLGTQCNSHKVVNIRCHIERTQLNKDRKFKVSAQTL